MARIRIWREFEFGANFKNVPTFPTSDAMGGQGMEFGEKLSTTKMISGKNCIWPLLPRIRRRCDDDVLSDFVRKSALFGQLCDGRMRPVTATTFFGAHKYFDQW